MTILKCSTPLGKAVSCSMKSPWCGKGPFHEEVLKSVFMRKARWSDPTTLKLNKHIFLSKSQGPDSKIKIFFLSGFSFADTDDSQATRGKEGTIFYSTLPLPPAHEHWGIYLQLCMWDDYHIFLIATLVFTRLLLDRIYHLIELPFDWLMWH